MSYFVYLIISVKKKKPITYVGYTSDITKRIKLHNESKGAKFTKGRNWTLVYKKWYKTKSSAMKNEYKLKKDQKKRNIIKNNFLKSLI